MKRKKKSRVCIFRRQATPTVLFPRDSRACLGSQRGRLWKTPHLWPPHPRRQRYAETGHLRTSSVTILRDTKTGNERSETFTVIWRCHHIREYDCFSNSWVFLITFSKNIVPQQRRGMISQTGCSPATAWGVQHCAPLPLPRQKAMPACKPAASECHQSICVYTAIPTSGPAYPLIYIKHRALALPIPLTSDPVRAW